MNKTTFFSKFFKISNNVSWAANNAFAGRMPHETPGLRDREQEGIMAKAQGMGRGKRYERERMSHNC